MAKEKSSKRKGVSAFRSVQTKITLTLALVAIVIVGGFGLYNLNEAQERIDNELQQLSETTVQRLSQHVIGPFWALNDEQVAEQLEAAMLEPRIYATVLRDRDRQTIYMGRERDGNWGLRPVDGTPTGDHVVSRTTLVRDDGEMIGMLEVYVTRQFLQEQFEELMLAELGRGISLALAIVIIGLIMLRRVVVRPIRELTEAADRISAGQLSTQINVQSKDEIGMLANAVGKLQTSLRIAMERMKRG